MPNFCCNDFYVRGEASQLEAFDGAFKGKAAFSPLPAAMLATETSEEAAQMVEENRRQWEETPEDYYLHCLYPIPQEVLDADTCYDWCIEHWGTKWEMQDENSFRESALVENNGTELLYGFFTAWEPPTMWLQKVAADWPELSFELEYEEPGQSIAGRMVCEKGQTVVDEDCSNQ